MRPGEDSGAFAYFAVHYCGFGLARLNCKVLGILGENLNFAGAAPELVGVHVHPATVVVALELVGERYWLREGLLRYIDLGSSGATLAVVLEPLKGATTACAGEEGEFPAPYDFQLRVPNLELATTGPIVATGAETQESASETDKLGDAAVAGAVQGTAVAEVGTTREDKEGASGSPGFFEKCRLGDGVHGVVGAE